MTGRGVGFCTSNAAPGYANAYGRGRGGGGGRGWGRGIGRGFRGGGKGFGFRGSSPPWPYVGVGRGGLSRCGYFLGGAGGQPTWSYQQTSYPFYGETPATPGEQPLLPQMTKDEELDYLKDQAEMIKGQLEQIGTRMSELDSEE